MSASTITIYKSDLVLHLLLAFLLIFSQTDELLAAFSYLIEGDYQHSQSRFTGTVSFEIQVSDRDQIYFHLPPKWNTKPDLREKFLIPTKELALKAYRRSELDELKQYQPRNLHLAKDIRIEHVTIDNHPVQFYLKNNQALPPGRSVDESLLVVKLDGVGKDQRFVGVCIRFQTDFEKLPSEFNTILWDYAPRPVLISDTYSDFADFYTHPSTIKTELSVISGTADQQEIHLDSTVHSSVPVIVMGGSQYRGEEYVFIPDRNLAVEAKSIQERIRRVQTFLLSSGWLLPSENKRYYVFWDGPLTVTGDYILLPRRLFRYHPLFYKTFEFELIKACVEATIRTKYRIASSLKPWLLPALYGEVVRSYFQVVYQSDTRFFFWGYWLNPDIYLENSVKPWISYPEDYVLASADEPMSTDLASHIYHPWQAKGFHLLRTIVGNRLRLEGIVIPSLKDLLTRDLSESVELNEDFFFASLEFTSHERMQTELWFSQEGKVDYEIAAASMQNTASNILLEIEILNHGTLGPSFDLHIVMEDGNAIVEEINSGAGNFRFTVPSRPIEIQIDPNRKLLENNILNNSWNFPYKIRPIWDFPSPENVIITVSPVITGNTFDRNLFGIDLGLGYLNKIAFNLVVWKGDGDETALWESSIKLSGKPWLGSEWFFQSSELNAAHSLTLGFKHRFIEKGNNSWLLMSVSEEDLDNVDDTEISSGYNKWQSIKSQFGLPWLKGNFSDAYLNVAVSYGRNFFDERIDYYQQSFNNLAIAYFGSLKAIVALEADYSHGSVPTQKRYSLGGPEGLPGFPRETELLFEQRRIVGVGLTAPPFLTHSNIQLFRLGWLDRIESTLVLHWGQGGNNQSSSVENFQDIEIKFAGFAEWLNMYRGEGVFSIAMPIGHERYRDYRIILFSNWVF